MHSRAMRDAAALWHAAAFLLVLALPVSAQRSISLDVGGASLRYADTLSTSALAISPVLRFESPRAALHASGTFSQLRVGGWSTQGQVDGALFSPTIGPFLGEVSGSAGASAHRDGTRTGQSLVGVRAHLMDAHWGVWAGAGAGGTWDGDAWRSVRQADLGAWAERDGTTAMLTASPTAVEDTIEYTDAVFSLSHDARAIELGAMAGYRMGTVLPVLGGTGRAWGSVSLVAWLTHWAGLVAGAGTYPVDLTQGFPGGRFLSLGVRFRAQHSRSTSAVVEPIMMNGTAINPSNGAPTPSNGATTTLSNAIIAFEAVAAPNGLYMLRVHAPRASRAEISADFTDWQPLRLTAAGAGWWKATVRIERGVHQLNARIDGGAWLVPPGLTAVADEFGGSVGIFTVPR